MAVTSQCTCADLFLLCGNVVEEVGQAGEQRLLGALVACLVFEHLLPEGSAEIQCLQHRIAVAGVAELKYKAKSVMQGNLVRLSQIQVRVGG